VRERKKKRKEGHRKALSDRLLISFAVGGGERGRKKKREIRKKGGKKGEPLSGASKTGGGSLKGRETREKGGRKRGGKRAVFDLHLSPLCAI